MTRTAAAAGHPEPTSSAVTPAPDAAGESFAVCIDALRRRRQRIAQLEAELVGLKRDLSRFEAACQTRVGDLLTELRRATAAVVDARRDLARFLEERGVSRPEILDAMFDNLDLDPRGYDELWDDLEYARDPDRDPDGDEGMGPSFPPGEEPAAAHPRSRVDAPEDLKRLYRELAKRCHPDLAPTPEEHRRRETLMLRINAAYDEGDADTLRGLLLETEAEAPGFDARPMEERLRWAREELARLDSVVSSLRNDLAGLRSGDLHRMWQRGLAGEPVMEELEDDLERQIRSEGLRLDRLTALRRRLMQDRPLPVAS